MVIGRNRRIVTPAYAGIQVIPWIPVSAGMTEQC